jgi:hypothetical protein
MGSSGQALPSTQRPPWVLPGTTTSPINAPPPHTSRQGLKFVHFPAQLKRFMWDRGYIQGLFRGCLGGVVGYEGALRVYFASETAQVELKGERV